MALFADGGLFFNEWYWGPIGRAFLALPLLGIVAFATALVTRRWIPDLGHRVWVAVAIIVGGEALVLGGGLYLASGQDVRESRAIARTATFTTYAPRSLPPRFSVLRGAAAQGDPTSIDILYSVAGNGWASAIQEAPPGEGHTRYSRRCLLEGRTDPCREVRTRKGIRLMLAATGANSLEASAKLDGTLVHLSGYRITEPEMLGYFDALRPAGPDELEFKRG